MVRISPIFFGGSPSLTIKSCADLDKKLGKLPSKVSPSDAVKDAHNVRALLDDREIYRNQVPVALFSGPLATLQARLEKNDAAVSSHEVSRAATYITQAIAFYDDEKLRQAAICRTIDSALGSEGQWEQKLGWASDIKPDRCWFAGVFLSMVLELKNTPGIAGDPVLQCIADLSKIVPNSKVLSHSHQSKIHLLMSLFSSIMISGEHVTFQ